MLKKINVHHGFQSLAKAWNPVCIGAINESLVKLARFEGDYVWHAHADEDEGFLVVAGQMILKLRDQDVVMNPGDFFVVPRGVEHLPSAPSRAEVLIFVPASQINTGNVVNDLTKTEHTWLSDAVVRSEPGPVDGHED